MTHREPLFLAQVKLHPGRPDRSVMLAAIRRIVNHDDPRIDLTMLEMTGQPVPRDDPAEAVVDGWEAAGCPQAYGVTARGGKDHTVVISTVDRPVGTLGGLDVYWTLDRSLTDGLTALLVDLSEVASSPLAVLTHAGRGLERAGWTSREGKHMLAVEGIQGPVFYGLRLGLAGVAHRMVLGDELVAMLGEHRLAALPPELAQRRNGRWVLTPTDDPLEWTYDRWCPGEAAIIEALGREHFFDPSTGALPSVVPGLPAVAPYRCRTREPGTDVWVEHNA